MDFSLFIVPVVGDLLEQITNPITIMIRVVRLMAECF